MDDSAYSAFSSDPTIYLYTSLTAGSSHIITATSRLETILKANKIPFHAIDVATDDKARMLWGRRSKGKKLPGLVRYGMIVGDLDQIEEWNEFGELKQQIGNSEAGGTPSTTTTTSPPKSFEPPSAPAPALTSASPNPRPTSTAPHIQIADTPSRTSSAAGGKEEHRYASALRQAGEEAATKAKENTRDNLGVKPKSSLNQAEEAVAETAISSHEPTTSSDKKDEDEPPSTPLKDAQRRASVQVETEKRPDLEAVESTGDLQATNESLHSAERRREPVVSATSPGQEEKVVKDLHGAVDAAEEDNAAQKAEKSEKQEDEISK